MICIIIGPVRSLAQPCVVNNTFFSLWGGQKWGFSLRIPHIAPFYTINFFFLIAPRDLHYYWASAQPCAALRSLAQLTTPFLASGKAKNGVFFPKDRTYRAFFVLLHKRNFFRMAPERLNAFGTFVHAAESAN